MADAHRRSPIAIPAGARVDLALTLPVFLAYHLGVVFLSIRNASDVVTGALMEVAEGNKSIYLLLTLAIGVVFAGAFAWIGRGQAFRLSKFVQIAIEGVVYALLMRLAGSYVVGHMFAGRVAMHGFPGIVMSLGAGFYEELTYRALLFGLGSYALRTLLFARGTVRGAVMTWAWALACAAAFSAMHYVGPLSDNFTLQSFVFRMVLGLALTLIFVFRGFAAAVWAHAFYDIWVLVL
ncbi:MAG TPA: CPBP family intramembrane glutamate endopeptidase [Polyangiaceae bacterium]|jgi:hypothetical protein